LEVASWCDIEDITSTADDVDEVLVLRGTDMVDPLVSTLYKPET